jgi:hypothetical protein
MSKLFYMSKWFSIISERVTRLRSYEITALRFIILKVHKAIFKPAHVH